ncbi:hypothetical protein BWI96_05990 [Siphonobacter sp. SORGH_AS_0500]|uniref:DUF4231 domain-containing protein n=1 Tax=Siphonobacter sp. SORGH_AS_0500 TaxID=1864824 RepID=UPI000CBF20FF|nr:DUF4231 domain-containing protein [Siphonobacter sp. SORGH_AS_0500]PKK37418.1 hypothetical protein BWI96_05990 [Siphonobacter sp. SORGH_AS_0500]
MDKPKQDWSDLSCKESARQYIDHVYKYYCKDYDKGSILFENLYHIFSILIILLGFLSSVLAALDGEKLLMGKTLDLKVALILLPLISSMLAAIITQFNIKEKYQLREIGRIKCTHLYTEARIAFAKAKIEDEFYKIHKDLASKIFALQSEQAYGFFNTTHKNEDMNKEKS